MSSHLDLDAPTAVNTTANSVFDSRRTSFSKETESGEVGDETYPRKLDVIHSVTSNTASPPLPHAVDFEKQLPPQTTDEKPPRDVHGFKWFLVVVSILSSIFLFSLDNTIVADIQPAIVEEFGSVNKLPWLSVSFLLAAASTNLIWGKVYTQFNAKWCYVLTVGLFEAGSAICGAANSMDVLIFGRALCGLGGSGMYVGVMTLLSVTTTMRERPMYIGSTGLMWGIGTVLGPIIGGAFTSSSAGWRYSFWINLMVCALFAGPILLWVPSFDPRPGTSHSARWKEMDFVGGLLICGAFLSGVMAISFGGILYPWNSGQIIACFVISAVLFTLFGIQQEYALFTTVTRRIFPVHFMRNKEMLLLFALTACAATGVVVPLYMIPLFFQFTRADGALEAGVRLLPYIVLMVVFCIANGGILSKFGYYMPWYLVGGIFITVGSALMYTIDANSSTSAVYGYSTLVGIGVGCFIQASFSVAQALVPPEQVPQAVGFITCGQIGGITIAQAIANSVFLNTATSGIAALLPGASGADITDAVAGVGSSFVNGLTESQKEGVLVAIIGGMGKSYIGVIAAGALTVVLSLGLSRKRMNMDMAAAA
jgi:predicted MFS family arabinose efflux permease